ncbi:MAG: DeoR/GlpR family DNA-binding transcription regulator [Actinomycetia bacterium]|nr:DeoR/GlpR family DNA-binding transcription regulator [Actinomycetes bacterium]
MQRDERLRAILDLLGMDGTLDVDQIVETFGVSPATARRDLDVLAGRRLLNRTRGGATAAGVAYDLPLRYKREQHADAKARIAREAQSLIRPGHSIGFSGGTTITAVAADLATRPDIADAPEQTVTVVTNALNIAMQLAVRPQFRVVVSGGVIHSRSYELIGPYAEVVLERISLDVALLGVNGMDLSTGPTVHDEREARVNELLAGRAREAWIAADSSKLSVRALAQVAPWSAFHGLITDRDLPGDARRELESLGLDVRAV